MRIIIEAIKEPFYLYELYGVYGLKNLFTSWAWEAIKDRARD